MSIAELNQQFKSQGNTRLNEQFLAIIPTGNIEEALEFFANNIAQLDLNYKSGSNQTPLLLACSREGDYDKLVKKMIENGANIEQAGFYNNTTPLLRASSYNTSSFYHILEASVKKLDTPSLLNYVRPVFKSLVQTFMTLHEDYGKAKKQNYLNCAQSILNLFTDTPSIKFLSESIGDMRISNPSVGRFEQIHQIIEHKLVMIEKDAIEQSLSLAPVSSRVDSNMANDMGRKIIKI